MTRPTTNRIPAALRFEVIDSIGPENVCAADSGPIWVTMSVTFCVVDCGSATRPTIETRAISAGNKASSP